jgi:caffeoyl-CoA O-methyltransferase
VKEAADRIVQPSQAAYLEGLEPSREPLLAEMEAYARAHGEPISDPEVASFLAVTARATSPRTIVEVGTNIGYGAIVLARAAGPGARVVTIDKSGEMCTIARGFIAKAGLADRITVLERDALDALRALEGPVDLAYLDCVKEDYPEYLELLVPKLSERGVVIADNALWKGLVAADDAGLPEGERERVDALRAFNRALTTDPRIRGVVLPLGDGVAYAVRI